MRSVSAKTSIEAMRPHQMVEDNNDREATELNEQQASSHAQIPIHDASETLVDAHTTVRALQKEQHALKKFWKRQIAVSVDHEGCRDHFGTFPVRSWVMHFL